MGNAAATPVPLVSQYMGTRFSSPNDLTIRSDGIVYFTDPDYQSNPNDRQPEQRAYWFDPMNAVMINVIPDTGAQPNGITLSLDEQTLYVASSGRIMAYPVNSDGSLGAGAIFGPDSIQGVDGMGIDCAGNIYAAVHGPGNIVVISPSGEALGSIDIGNGVTNVAFGGPNRTTAYITKLNQPSLYEIEVGIIGLPY